MDEPSAQVREWLRSFVVGLNVCPYARGPMEAGKVRIAVAAGDLQARLWAVAVEAERLLDSPTSLIETTLLVLPDAPSEFEAFLHETDLAMEIVESFAADELQVVAFHPLFCFADAAAEDPGNRTNQSPLALWHLLREASVTRVVDADPDGVREIPDRNQALLRALNQ